MSVSRQHDAEVESPGAVGLVVAGAAARGAYEAGALAALLPHLEKDGRLPRVLLGTSAGSINVAYLAAKLHLGAEKATSGLLDVWRSLNKPNLMGPLWKSAVPALIGYAGRIAYLHTGSGSIAGFGKFAEVFDAAIGNWSQIQTNLADGVLDAVGLVATSAADGGSVVFLQAAKHVITPPLDDKKGIAYFPAQLSADHVIASSSIPIFFPPKEIAEPHDAHGWYWDGGIRLNTPITPALAIGGDRLNRLVIVSTGPPRFPAPGQGDEHAKPDFDDALLNVIQATLDDSLIEDLHSLVRVNRLVKASRETTLDGRREYEYLFAGPKHHGVLGHVAAEVLKDHYGPLHPINDFAVINRLLGRQGKQGAELQSYLLFESDFIDKLLKRGRDDGELAWHASPRWLSDVLPAP